ncbi:mitochondrial inner membrane protease subunit [Niveomyces insectorum RCEF 264]|uniref:Mitochondrial inner membrane protease subunit 2 n=1 Tax=Niveomyces insectorum RCEF 264 TaxID=1081102 RepID=A0A167WWP7_9HYPO|nr:mitochondrial inner membrane protease subunit [Niveomyces insectorum RCEF 264]
MNLGSLWARLRAVRGGHGGPLSSFPSSSSSSPASPVRAPFVRQFARYLLGFATWLPVAIWFNSTVAEVTLIEGPSMYPFLNSRINESLARDWVLNRKLYAQDDLQRGMIVFLRSPVHPEVVSVKRIIGLEGDVVQTRAPYPTAYVRVPAGHIWVEGDAGEGRSLDSNTYGPASIGLVTGRLTHILLPFSKAGRVRWWEYPVHDRTVSSNVRE